MTFELIILGSSSALPTSTRHPTAQLLNVDEHFFLIDCGEATQMQLRKYKLKFQRINHIFISHLHGDHYLGLMGLLSTMHLLGRKNEIHIYAPPGLKEIIDVQYKYAKTGFNYNLAFHFLKMDEPEILFEDEKLTVETILMNHKIPCWGFVFREKSKSSKSGRSFAYCSDTCYDESIIEKIKGVDVLYHEATYMQNMLVRAKETFHSTTIEAGTIAKKAEVKKLIIGHYSARYKDLEPLLEETKSVFENTVLAVEGEKYLITPQSPEGEVLI